MRKRKNNNSGGKLDKSARQLLKSPQFLFKVLQKLRELGVIGESRNLLVLFLACLTRTLPKPASVIVKGPTSSGKSTLVEAVVRLFPPSCIVERAGLSRTAHAYATGPLKGKILFLNEYRCGKDSQLFTRLLQTQGQIKHEATVVRGGRRRTQVMKRVGRPVVLTTTTDERVFADDETRFLSISMNQSPRQTRRIVLAQSRKPTVSRCRDLALWQETMSRVKYKNGDFENPPAWLEYVAKRLPLDELRVRRDWDRVLNFCQALALWRSFEDKKPIDISFQDYCIAYRILEPVLASTTHESQSQESFLGKAVATLYARLNRPVTVREIAEELGWKGPAVYKYLKIAVKRKLVSYEGGTRERNVKRVLPIENRTRRFLPTPRRVMRHNRELGKEVHYRDPFTGAKKAIFL